jgi:hypothetical protein
MPYGSIQYLLPVLAFAAVFVGIFGGAWDPKLSRLTILGWATVGIAAATMIGSITLARRAAWIAHQRSQVKNIGEIELRDAAYRLLRPFFLYSHLPQFGILDEERAVSDIDFLFHILKSPDFLARLAAIDLREGANVSPRASYGLIFAESARDSNELFEQAIAKYSAYLAADALLKVHAVRSSDFFWLRLKRMDEHLEMNADVEKLALDERTFGQRNEDYFGFLDQVAALLKALPPRPEGYRGFG